MRDSHSLSWFRVLTFVGDAIAVGCAGQLSLWLVAQSPGRESYWPMDPGWASVWGLCSLVLPFVAYSGRGYSSHLRGDFDSIVWVKCISWLTVFLSLLVVLFLAKASADVSRAWLVSWFFLGCIALTLSSLLTVSILVRLQSRGHWVRRVLLLGGGPLAQEVVARLDAEAWLGIVPVGYIAESSEESIGSGVPYLGAMDDLESALEQCNADELWVAVPSSEYAEIGNKIRRVRERLIDVRLIPDATLFGLSARDLQNVAGMPLIGLSVNPQTGLHALVKRAIDLVGAAVFLLLFSPVLLVIAVLICADSPGGVIYLQLRHGKGGRPFRILKFRTMYSDASERAREFQQARRQDSRVTRVGKVLRRYSLDELPQLINVLRGEMSLVGPRPHPVQMNHAFWDAVGRYEQRHHVAPGITGWAQVQGYRGETADEDQLRKRIEHDLFYVDHWTIWLDLKILFKTLLVGFRHPNAY